jgi:hypothetical protein
MYGPGHAYCPDDRDHPRAEMGGPDGDIPILYLQGDSLGLLLQFRSDHGRDAETVAYLLDVEYEAKRLRQMVEERLRMIEARQEAAS